MLFSPIGAARSIIHALAGYRLVKEGAHVSGRYPLSGPLYVDNRGRLVLQIPSAFVRGVFAALDAPGVELFADGRLAPRVVVMTRAEVDAAGGPERITERGKTVAYTFGRLVSGRPRSRQTPWSRVWAVEVHSPSLVSLRRSYGLSDTPTGRPFVVIVAVRRKHVLGRNPVAKGGLKSAAVDSASPLGRLLEAKARSDVEDYETKNELLRELVEERPHEFIIDQPDAPYPGLTHVPTNFRIHAHPSVAALLRSLQAETARSSRKPRHDKASADNHPGMTVTLAVDFDGTLADEAGRPREPIVTLVRYLHTLGVRIILHTVRDDLPVLRAWCAAYNVPVDAINVNPDQPTTSPKPWAHVYLDDRAVDARDTRRAVRRVLRRLAPFLEDQGVPPELLDPDLLAFAA